MLNTHDYEVLKKSLIDAHRLFDKLNKVADNASKIEYDESGLFFEDEEICKRHFLKLSSKIVDILHESLQSYDIKVLENESQETRVLRFELSKEDELSQILVDYGQRDGLSISQLS